MSGIKSVNFFYKNDGSDKVYQLQIDKSGAGYAVNFQYGARGSTLKSGSKTPKPVSFEEAERIFQNQIDTRLAKGYTESPNGTPYQDTEQMGELSGLMPQLLNPIDLDKTMELIKDDSWLMQEKIDGIHMMARITEDKVVTSNRKGKIISPPISIYDSLKFMKNFATLDLDGEAVGDRYFLYDILMMDSTDLKGEPSEERFIRLVDLISKTKSQTVLDCIHLVRCAGLMNTKLALFRDIKANNGEGVVFKKKGSLYVPGRPNSMGNMLKFKFKGSATCLVIGTSLNKRSVELAVYDYEKTEILTPVGKVTIPPNYSIPNIEDIVEVEYLYAYKGGSLFQPVFKGQRTDKSVPDQYSTLKFKAEGADEEG
jgi:bifunctional non-homologous end joining protein LigD